MRMPFKALLSVMVAIAFALGAATAASASATPDRSDHQQLSTGYQITVRVPAFSAAEDANQCASGHFCTWTGTDFTGTMIDCSGQLVWCHITALPVGSFENNTPYRVWLQQFQSHTSGGREVCTNGGDLALDFTSNPNSSDPWAWLSTNQAAC